VTPLPLMQTVSSRQQITGGAVAVAGGHVFAVGQHVPLR
jgi:hypothetical protein